MVDRARSNLDWVDREATHKATGLQPRENKQFGKASQEYGGDAATIRIPARGSEKPLGGRDRFLILSQITIP